MNLLRAVWLGSWIMAGSALAWMTLLILARLVRDFGAARRSAAHQSLIDGYLKLMRGDAAGLDQLQAHRKRPRLMAEALLQILDVVRGGQRDRLLEALQAFGLDETLRRQAGRAPAAARLVAIEALACFPGAASEEAVRTAGRKAGGAVRVAAAKSLAAMGAHIDLDLLIGDMRRRREAWSGAMSDLMRLLAERQPEDCLRALQRQDLPAALRALIAEGLAACPDYKEVVPVLSQRALTDEPAVRAAALTALGRLMHPSIEPVVVHGLADGDWQIRGAAAGAAGAAGLRGVTPDLGRTLDDPVWWVRFKAAEALAQFGPEGLDVLRRAAEGGSAEAARVASLTLAERRLQ